jgi:ketosteroid isomerase-like protein
MKSLVCLLSLLTVSCSQPADDFKPDTIVALERAALDRWNNGDPGGYLDTYAPEVSYFDPTTEKRIDGIDAMRAYYAPLKGKIHSDRYEIRNVSVQRHGDAVALSYNLYNFGVTFDGQPVNPNRPWNSTKIYARVVVQGVGKWKIVHDHWSHIKPDLK